MKVARGAILGILLYGTTVWAAPFQMSYSGLFPANRDGKSVQTYLLLLDQPRQLLFSLTDEKGNPQPNVRVVEVFTSGASGAIKNAEGITQADLTESGIYELRVSADPRATGELGFVLKVADTGTPPVVAPAPIQAVPPALPPASTASPGPSAPPAPAPATPAEVVASPPSSVSGPSVPVPTAPLASPEAAVTQPPVPVPAVPASPVENAATPPDTAPLLVAKRYPQGIGYADPYRPVEVLFDRPIPGNPAPEAVLQVGLLAPDGAWKAVQGQWFASGKNGVRFLPKRLMNGAVYHVRVFDPRTQAKLDEFSYSSFPEVRLSLAKAAEGFQGDLDWVPATETFPGAEGQVVKLENSELVVKADDKEIARFPFSPEMPPFGTRDEMTFQGRPCGFTLVVPPTRIGPESRNLTMSLFTKIAGREGWLEVARTALTMTHSTSVGLVASATGVSSASLPVVVPPVVASAAITVSPVPETSPVLVSTPAEPEITQVPVIPIPDPGPGATVLPENEFSAAENPASAHKCWPRGVSWGPDGALWVVDSQNRRILKFNDLGKLMLAFGTQGKGMGMLRLPLDLAFGAAEVFVSDSAAHAIHVFDFKGTPLRSIGTWGTRPGQVDLPHGVDFADGQIWLAERGNAQIMRFGLDGIFLSGFGKKGNSPGCFDSPVGIRVFGNTVWVMEPKKGRIQRFTRDGKYLGGFIAGTIDAVGFDIDPWGCAWVADGEGHRVLRYDATGKLLVNIESPIGDKAWNPTSVSVRSDGLVAVGDAGNRMIRLYRLKKP